MTTEFEWVPGPVPAALQVRQVYGILFSETGLVFLQNDDGRYNLPGGKPDPEDRGFVQTLSRETLEESSLVIADAVYLGYISVTEAGADPYAQVRMIARITKVLPNALDPASGRRYGRILVPIGRAVELLSWGRHGVEQFAAAASFAPAALSIRPTTDFLEMKIDDAGQ